MMRRPSPRQRRLVILTLAGVIFGLAYYAGNNSKNADLPQISGALLRPPSAVPEFSLHDQDDKAFSSAQLQGHWSLLALDPAPDATASTVYRLAQIYNRLADDPPLQRQSRFITIPRQRSSGIDTAAARLGAAFIALHGDDTEIGKLFQHLGIIANQQVFTLYLIDPQARIEAMFTDQQDATGITRDLKTLINYQR